MTKPNGFLKFNTPEDYLAYQDILIKNWMRHYEYKYLTGNTTSMLSETYRQTGRTWSAVTAAVQLAERPENNKVVFVVSKTSGFPNHYFQLHPLLKEYSDRNDFSLENGYVGNILIVPYHRLSLVRGDHYIYDHLVFEMCEPTYVPVKDIDTTIKDKTIKLLMEKLEKVEQEASKIRNQISNLVNLKK